MKYRPALDGLRAIAVSAVLLFHLNPSLLPGGFVGVDVFFVLSGYLITSILLRDYDTGRFSLVRFYQRRIARIFPASFLVVIAVLIAAKFIYSAQDYASAGATTIFAALSLANVKLMLLGDYFQVTPDAQPLLHFWSLSVEEQFYVFFPFGLGAYLSLRKRHVRLPKLFTVVSVLAAISLISCVWVTALKPAYAFYLLPTRAWELLAGCLLAIYVSGLSDGGQGVSERSNRWLSFLGLGLVLASFVVIEEGAHFPGVLALLPVVGTVLCIGFRKETNGRAEQMLSNRAIVFIGKISYSLYLWHWPVYCFTDYALFAEDAGLRIFIKLGLTLVLSLLSYYIYEHPLRIYLNISKNQLKAYCVFLVTVAILVVGGYNIRKNNYLNARASMVQDGGIRIDSNSEIETKHIVLFGDSRASMYGKMIAEVAESFGVNVNIISLAAGHPFSGSEYYEDSMAYLSSSKPDLVIMSASWTHKNMHVTQHFEQVVSDMTQHAKHFMVITDIPTLPKGVTRAGIREHGVVPILEPVEDRTKRENTMADLHQFSTANVHLLDVADLFITNESYLRFTREDGQQLWNDPEHLSHRGSELIVPRLEEALKSILEL